MTKPLRVLIVEDDESQVLLTVRQLKKEGFELVYEWVMNRESYFQALTDKEWDVIICDYAMPGFTGEDALVIYNEQGLDIPFILMSGTVGEDIAVRMLKSGAKDYIMKDKMSMLGPAVERELKDFSNRVEKKKADAELAIAQSIIKASPVFLWKWAPYPQKEVLYVSDNVISLGYHKEDFINGNIPFETIIHPEDKPYLADLRDKYNLSGKDKYEMQYRIHTADGSVRWVIDQTSVIRDDKGEAEYTQGLIIDITETYLVKKALDESEQRLRIIVENTPVGIDLLDMEGNFLEVNKAFCNLTGYSQEELLKMNFRDITVPDDLPENEKQINALLSGKIPYIDFTKRYRCKDGSIIWVEVFASIFRDDSGKPLYFVTQAQDITARVQAEHEIQLAKAKAEESNRVKSALLANMSHEFRTPMNGILGFADLINKADVSSTVIEMSNLIKQSGKRLLRTLESIMLLAQLETENFKSKLKTETIDLSSFLNSLVIKFQPKAQDKKLSLKLEAIDELQICLDSTMLKHALYQVIENAIKFTEEGSVTISVKHQIIDNQSWVQICVIDTGISITENHIGAIFKEFVQLSEGYSRRYEGAGVGLTIAKKIIDLFEGRIEVQRNTTQGTTVTILLPVSPALSDTLEEPLSTAVVSHQKIRINRILVVEDNSINAKLLKEYLSICEKTLNCSYEIDYAVTGEGAIQMTAAKHYDIILMDINLLPGMDGLTATQHIRKVAGYAETPIVAVTGYVMPEDKDKLLDGGCSHYLGKPFDKDDIIRIMQDIAGM